MTVTIDIGPYEYAAASPGTGPEELVVLGFGSWSTINHVPAVGLLQPFAPTGPEELVVLGFGSWSTINHVTLLGFNSVAVAVIEAGYFHGLLGASQEYYWLTGSNSGIGSAGVLESNGEYVLSAGELIILSGYESSYYSHELISASQEYYDLRGSK